MKKQSPLEIFAWIVSVVFHPLFLLSYAVLLLAWANPYLFGESSFARLIENKTYQVEFLQLTIYTVLFPLFGILLMLPLGLISSIRMPDKQERIGPYILTGLLYVWIFLSFKNDSHLPLSAKVFALGTTIALFTAFFINLFSKISIHTVGMGGFLAMLLIIMTRSYQDFSGVLILGIIAAGLVGTARLVLKAHEPNDIYGGYFIGFVSQFVAITALA